MDMVKKTKDKYEELKKRYSNGCTGVPDFNFSSCCDDHDIGYTFKDKSRLYYDWQLFKCVRKKRNSAIIATGYFLGVRALGFYWWRKAKK